MGQGAVEAAPIFNEEKKKMHFQIERDAIAYLLICAGVGAVFGSFGLPAVTFGSFFLPWLWKLGALFLASGVLMMATARGDA
jgi:fatty acid desaturase